MKKILVAGATGYLGCHIINQLLREGMPTKAIARNVRKLDQFERSQLEVVEVEATDANTLKGVMDDVDVVISSIGITRQKDGLTYEQVDYQANLNLLNAAKRSGVKKFIYVSVLNGQNLRHLQICKAKERFVDVLKSSGVDYAVVRPNGFFTDMNEYLEMAKKGSIYIFGDGKSKSNPIHGSDLAKVCIAAIDSTQRNIEAGGPVIYTQLDIAALAFDAINKPPSVIRIPDLFRRIALSVLRIFTPVSVYGPFEFFLTVLSIDMIAPETGEQNLGDFFKDTIGNQTKNDKHKDEHQVEANNHG